MNLPDKHGTPIYVADDVRLLEQPDGCSSKDYPLTIGCVYEVLELQGGKIVTTSDEPGINAIYHCSRVEKVDPNIAIKYAAEYEDGYYRWLGETSRCRTNDLKNASLYDDLSDVAYYQPGAKPVKVRVTYEVLENKTS